MKVSRNLGKTFGSQLISFSFNLQYLDILHTFEAFLKHLMQIQGRALVKNLSFMKVLFFFFMLSLGRMFLLKYFKH